MVSGSYVAAWARAFVFTQVIEVPIHGRALAHVSPRARRYALAVGASALTHPVVWFVLPELQLEYAWYFLVAEGFATVTEAVYLHLLGTPRALLWSIAANGASVALGALTRALTGLP